MQIDSDDSPWTIPAPAPAARISPGRRLVLELAGLLGARPQLVVRETLRGYVIEQPLTLAPVTTQDRRALAGVGVVTVASALLGGAGIGLAFPQAGWTGAVFVGGQAGIAGMVASLVQLLRGRLRVEVDCQNRCIRVSRIGRRGSRILVERPFGSVSELVLQRGQGSGMRLCLRAGEGSRPHWQVIAVGDEEVLRALHRRIARDLAPLEKRVAAAASKGRSTRRALAFPSLGPHELLAG